MPLGLAAPARRAAVSALRAGKMKTMFGSKKDRTRMGQQAEALQATQSEEPPDEAPPAPPAPPAEQAEQALSDAEKGDRLAQLQELLEMVRPIIQQDGGDLVLVSADVVSGVVELQLQGACSSCAISSSTLQAGVERIMKERLPWVSEIIGGVDEDMDWEESAAMGRGAYVPKW
jgi:Fe-S cluster biogenesis protein NfuA